MLYRGKLISFGTVYVYSKGKKEDESDLYYRRHSPARRRRTRLEDHTLHVVTACSPIVKHSIVPLCITPSKKQEVKIVVHVSLQLNGPVETHQPAAEC